MSATNRGAIRNEQDFYATPEWCVDLILNEIIWPPDFNFLEPCKGTGVIINAIPTEHKSWCEIQEGRDYLNKHFWDMEFDFIMTNPPYSLAQEFLEKSLKEAKTVVYLLRLNFLGSQKRRKFWQENRPTHLFVLSKRPSFNGTGTDATEYAWFVWDYHGMFKREPGIYVL